MKEIKVSYAGCHHTHVFDSAEAAKYLLDSRGLGESIPVVNAKREIIGYHAWGMCSRECLDVVTRAFIAEFETKKQIAASTNVQ
jgi:hypothetical protein